MRKPRGVQIRANRLIGPWEVLGGDDRRVPAKGRGRTAPYRGRSGASWIWSTPLDAGASEGELRSGYALTPSPSHSKNNLSFFTERRTPKRVVSEDGYRSFFLSLVWGFPIVAAGIPFVVDHDDISTITTGVVTPYNGAEQNLLRAFHLENRPGSWLKPSLEKPAKAGVRTGVKGNQNQRFRNTPGRGVGTPVEGGWASEKRKDWSGWLEERS